MSNIRTIDAEVKELKTIFLRTSPSNEILTLSDN